MMAAIVRRRFLLLIGLFLFVSLTPLHADEVSPINQDLHISFDLETGTLQGTSNIELPAGSPASIHVEGLELTRFSISDSKETRDELAAARQGLVTLEASDQPRRIGIIYTLTIPPDAFDQGMINKQNIVLTGVWHPVLENPGRLQLTADIPAGFEAISEADAITASTTRGVKEVVFDFPHPLQYRHFIAGPYRVTENTFGDGQKLYTYFFPEDRELAREYADKALAYLNRYIKLIGPYPYRRFSVVENRLPTGYAMPTFTLLGQAVVRLPFITQTSLGHEVLHSWFGNAVEADYSSGNWVEGLTTYLADQAYAVDEGRGPEFRKDQLLKYQSYVHGEDAVPLQQFTGAGSHLQTGNEAMRTIGYNKASMLFHMLRLNVGDDNFIKALQKLYTDHKYQEASWQDIEKIFSNVTDRDLSAFFSQWLKRSDVPEFELRDIEINEEDGQPVLTFLLVQKTEDPYQLTLPITITDTKGTISKEISVEDKETKVAITLPRLPQEMVVDDGYDVMRRLTPAELPPVWSRFAGAPQKIAVLPPEDKSALFAPLVEELKGMNCTLIEADKVKDTDVAANSIIFLGLESAMVRSLFAPPKHLDEGFVMDVRTNPLNPEEVAVLISAANLQEVTAALRKIRHYGKYSYVKFMLGQAIEKKITPAANGIHITLDLPPRSISTNATQSFEDLIEKITDSRVIYVGENHTRYQDHILQLRTIRALYEQDPRLAIGMEMFNRTTQEVLDRYLAGEMEEKDFLKETHYFEMWGYDYRLYRDIINFAKINHLPVIALNIEKETVSKVYKDGGLSALTPEEVAKLPEDRDLTLLGYRQRIADAFKMHGPGEEKKNQVNDFFQAQAIWDETMAESAARFLTDHLDQRLVIIAGQGHTVKGTGIPPRVARRLSVKQSVLMNAEEQMIDPAQADYLLFLTPAELPPMPMLGVVLEKTDSGIKISKLSPHGKAKDAGIREEDMLLAIDDQPVAELEDVKIIMLYKKKGDNAKVRIKRDRRLLSDKVMDIEVPL